MKIFKTRGGARVASVRQVALFSVALFSSAAPCAVSTAPPPPPTTVPARSSLFAQHDWAEASISADGRWVAIAAGRDVPPGVTILDTHTAVRRTIAIPGVQRVRWTRWARESARLIVCGEYQGDSVLSLVDPVVAAAQSLTLPGDRVVEEFATYLNGYAFTIERIERGSGHDVFDLDPDGRWQAVSDPGNLVPPPIAASGHVVLRGGSRGNDLVWTARRLSDPAATIVATPEDRRQGTTLVSISKGGDAWFLSSQDSDTLGLELLDLAKGQRHRVVQPDADITRILINPVDGVPDAYLTERGEPRWTALREASGQDLARLSAAGHGLPTVLDRSADDRFWLVAFANDERPRWFAVYDRKNRAIREVQLIDNLAGSGTRLARGTRGFVATGRDGRQITGHVTLPAKGRCAPAGCAAVVLLHGGPGLREDNSWRPDRAWLASRGYAVLTVDYRGSAGFGKAFENADRGEWGTGINDDIDEFVDAAIAHFGLDRRRVAIGGSSFGGYAALIALGRSDRYACGVVDSAFADLEAFVQDGLRRAGDSSDLPGRVADPRTIEGRKELARRSPMSMLDRLAKRPLLQFHGGEDQIVPMSINRDFALAMREQPDYTLVFFPQDGHGLLAPASQRVMHAATEGFLGRCLGGSVQPADADEWQAIQHTEALGRPLDIRPGPGIASRALPADPR